MTERSTIRGWIGLICCLALLALPMATYAGTQGGVLDKTQQGIEKGAKGVEKGAEKVYEGTKEGVEAVGKGAKKVVTGEESSSDSKRMKPSETQSTTTTKTTEESKSTTHPGSSETAKPMDKTLPATAGEFPLLILAGASALAAAGALRRRRT